MPASSDFHSCFCLHSSKLGSKKFINNLQIYDTFPLIHLSILSLHLTFIVLLFLLLYISQSFTFSFFYSLFFTFFLFYFFSHFLFLVIPLLVLIFLLLFPRPPSSRLVPTSLFFSLFFSLVSLVLTLFRLFIIPLMLLPINSHLFLVLPFMSSSSLNCFFIFQPLTTLDPFSFFFWLSSF